MRFKCTHMTSLTLCATVLVGAAAVATSHEKSEQRFGPNWEEGVGNDDDAGDTRETAAEVKSSDGSSTEVRAIIGSTKGDTEGFLPGTEGDWQDVFAVFIKNPANFAASTSPSHNGSAQFNTMMWLFSPHGTALLGNDNTDNGVPGSTLLASSTDGIINLAQAPPGVYYLAVSGFNSMPQTVNGDPMFPFPGQDGVIVSPTPQGFLDEVGSWNPDQTPGAHGDYVISLPPDTIFSIPLPCGEVESGNCFEANGSGGCDRLQCCTLVCVQDPFCCDMTWDQQCANIAAEQCVTCGNPSTGSCTEPHKTPFCNDEACCKLVCEIDESCCSIKWDENCAQTAVQLCTFPCPGQCTGDLNNDGAVTGGDLGILLAEWTKAGCGDLNEDGQTDGGDLGLLLASFGPCSACGEGGNETCFDNHASPSCNDPACCDLVCTIDPACCVSQWDEGCVALALSQCTTTCGHPNNGACGVAHASPSCSNELCCQTVCEMLPRCCEVMWDQDCVDVADILAECGG